MEMKVVSRICSLVLISGLMVGCASKSSDIQSSYVSPMKFNSYSCSQLEQEYARLLTKSSSINAQQDSIATKDAVATGVGLVVFWPALFFIDTDDHKEEVARLKGELEAVESSSIQKNCSDLITSISSDRKAAMEAARKRQNQD